MIKGYLYRHIRLDKNVPFYIGIGSDTIFKRAYAKDNRSSYWNKIVNKSGYRVEIIMENIPLNELFKKEIEFIDLYKRTRDGGTLCNITTGGEGTFGLKHSDKTKEFISKLNKGNKNMLGKKHSMKTRIQISENSKGKILSEETKHKISIATTGNRNPFYQQTHTEEAKNKISKANKGENNANYGKPRTLEVKLKIGLWHKGKSLSDVTRKKISDAKSIPVLQYSLDGVLLSSYSSAAEAAKLINGSDGNIIQCCKGNRKTHKKFIWKHKN